MNTPTLRIILNQKCLSFFIAFSLSYWISILSIFLPYNTTILFLKFTMVFCTIYCLLCLVFKATLLLIDFLPSPCCRKYTEKVQHPMYYSPHFMDGDTELQSS